MICNNCKSGPEQDHLKCPGGTWCDCGCHPRELVIEKSVKPEGHVYLSTACLHALEPGRDYLHTMCQTGGRRWDGSEKVPACCKYCASKCVCACHVDETVEAAA